MAHVCLRDGSIHSQDKIHPTPNEAWWWKIRGGDSVDVIQTDVGPMVDALKVWTALFGPKGMP